MKFSHINQQGKAQMVDISGKSLMRRIATAEGKVLISPETYNCLCQLNLPKGAPIEVARLAGIQAAKQTSRLIPLCHSISLDWIDVQIELCEYGFKIRSEVRCRWATGVEMEALTAVSVAALTLYDMCKAVDKSMVIEGLRLLKKTKK
tara:strand:+ start:49 stop:492 length:444 start_codon:yes stop_codon:yes gene_type:complete